MLQCLSCALPYKICLSPYKGTPGEIPRSLIIKSMGLNPHSRQTAVLTKITTNSQVEGESLSFLVTYLTFQFPFLKLFFFKLKNLHLDFGAKQRALNETKLPVSESPHSPTTDTLPATSLRPMLLISQCSLRPSCHFSLA